MIDKEEHKYKLFTPQNIENVHTFKYRGGDRGLTYNYFYSPLADKLVNYLPDNLA